MDLAVYQTIATSNHLFPQKYFSHMISMSYVSSRKLDPSKKTDPTGLASTLL